MDSSPTSTNASPRIAACVIFWFIGGGVLLLLNGKPYSNLQFFIGAVTLSALLWGWEMVSGNRQRLAWLVLMFHLLVISASIGSLSAMKRKQDQFENAVRRVREISK